MKKTKIKTQSATIGQIFWCYDCDKRWEDQRKARKQAYEHAKSADHYVTGEITTMYEYNDPEKK